MFCCTGHAALAEWYIKVKGQAQIEGIAIAGAAQMVSIRCNTTLTADSPADLTFLASIRLWLGECMVMYCMPWKCLNSMNRLPTMQRRMQRKERIYSAN